MKPSFDQNLLQGLLQTKPEAITLQAELAAVTEPASPGDFPAVVGPKVEFVELAQWLHQHQDRVGRLLGQFGGILFRGFPLPTAASFENAFSAVSTRLLHYTNRTSPRTLVNSHVYTSTDHPADQFIQMHTESSYAPVWPRTIGFFCFQPSATGGETPIADVRKVYRQLSPQVRDTFREKGVLYVRNMRKGMGLSWQEVYQTNDPAAVEGLLQQEGMAFEWVNADHLRVKWVRPAIRKHPLTGEWTWFNHAYFYHKKSLNPDLLRWVKEEELPFTAYFGDGSAIPDEVFDAIDAAYRQSLIVFPWQKGDFLLLDNMLMAHGRNPFTGDRKILVAMGDPTQA